MNPKDLSQQELARIGFLSKRSLGNFIDGEFRESRSGKRIDVVDPASEMVVADTPFGLTSSVWSNNLSAVHRIVPRIKAGTVWVNTHNLLDANPPFGGYKQSGFGRDLGRAAVESYTERKSVCMSV